MFEPNVVFLSKTHLEDSFWHKWKIVDWDVKNQTNQTPWIPSGSATEIQILELTSDVIIVVQSTNEIIKCSIQCVSFVARTNAVLVTLLVGKFR